jgi:HSP20 family molecular chaperone IbpA
MAIQAVATSKGGTETMFHAPAIRSNGLMPQSSSLFDGGFERFMNEAFGGLSRAGYDLQEDDQSWTLSIDVPGIPKENLDVQIEGQAVRVESTGDSKRKFKAAYELPNEIDVDGSTAKLENGVLTLTLRKARSATSRQITVQ